MTTKGTVSVYPRGSILTLRWRYKGRRFSLSLGVPDNALNRGVAATIGRQIEADIVHDCFDETLEKYLPKHRKREPQPRSLFKSFLSRPLKPQTMDIYKSAIAQLTKFGAGEKCTSTQAEDFYRWAGERLKPSSVQCYLIRLSAILKWGLEEQIVTSNPWVRVLKLVCVPPPSPAPFTLEEVDRILGGDTGHYQNFITFLLLSGVRLGEAIDLKWEHISEDFSTVYIYAPKTNQARHLGLPPRLQLLLKTLGRHEGRVFSSPEGCRIIKQNFYLAWRRILKEAGVPYRKAGNTRHTCASHMIKSGVPPVTVARLMGNSPAIVFKNYLGRIGEENRLPELFGGSPKGADDGS